MLLTYWIFIFACSLFVLIKSGDYFIEATEKLGFSLGIPSFIMGATLVALGTSLPELITSTFAAVESATEIVVGNVVGSNVSNILLILGITMLTSRSFVVPFKRLFYDYFILLISSAMLTVFIYDGTFGMIEGAISLAALAAYIVYTVLYHREKKSAEEKAARPKFPWLAMLIFLLSGMLIALSAKITVDSIIEIAEKMNTGEEIIALTILALGTSLPELVVSLAAAKRGQTDMILGNIIGSNIFNTFVVMGIPSMIKELVIPADVLIFSLPLMLIATLLLFFFSAINRTGSLVGILFCVLYLLFVVGIFLEFRLF